MIDFINLIPHRICLKQDPYLVWAHVLSDVCIGLAYFAIPIMLGYVVLKNPEFEFSLLVGAFALFIFACGTGHFIDAWNVFKASYHLSAAIRIATAIISIGTAILTYKVLRLISSMPTEKDILNAFSLERERRQALEDDIRNIKRSINDVVEKEIASRRKEGAK